jgi:hypothetical protein
MFNFNELICVVDDVYSFVGIERDNGQLKFYLPKGFKGILEEYQTFERKRDLFFLLYRVFRQFRSICTDKGYINTKSSLLSRDRDGVLQGSEGTQINLNPDESIILYAKIDYVAALLDSYDELKITSLAHRLGQTNRIDLSHIHKYIHKGIFLKNGAVYIDLMQLPRQETQFEATDIVGLYCYLVQEVKFQIHDEISSSVISLADNFRQRYLGNEDSLFIPQSYELVIDILKEALYQIDQRTPLKDSDYRQFYDAIERFLYGDWQNLGGGEVWGISNFHSVWESVCLNYLVDIIPHQDILFIDRKFLLDTIFDKVGLAQPRFNLSNAFSLNSKTLIPDAVILSTSYLKKMPSEYLLDRDRWDDRNYKTRFYCSSKNFKKFIKIAYIGQLIRCHTFEALKETYEHELIHSRVVVDKPLPKNYYSYWSMKIHGDEMIPSSFAEHLDVMRYFNHVFYVAFQQGITTFEGFQANVLPLLDVSIQGEFILGNNVFKSSIFRDRSHDLSAFDLQQEFDFFVSQVFNFELIDIKYMNLEYFQEDLNLNLIKERSVRKQFVYEYLLNDHLKVLEPKISPKIQSSFWIPSGYLNCPILSDGARYLDGYIELVNVNVKDIFEYYANLPVGASNMSG